jgi:sporulation protein YlmC with PRC-barrel domain
VFKVTITVKEFSEMFGKDVFTDKGMFCGRVADLQVDLKRFRVRALVIEAAKGSYLSELVGGKRGVILPYQFVQSIGDIVIIRHFSPSAIESRTESSSEETEVKS